MDTIKKPYYEKGDRYLLSFICAYLIFQSLNGLLSSMGIRWSLWVYGSRGVLGVFSLFAWIFIVKRNLATAICLEAFIGFSLLFTKLFGSVPKDFNSIVFNALLVYVPMGLSYLCVRDDELPRLYFRRSCLAIELLCLTNAWLYSTENYSMSLGYYLLLPLLFRLDELFYKFKAVNLVLAIVDFIAILAVASRGPLPCIALFFILRVFDSKTLSSRKKALIILVAIAVAAAISSVLVPLTEALLGFFESVGINSRTLRLLLNNSIAYDAGRLRVFKYYLSKLKTAGLFGFGVTGGWDYSSYPHNLILEILLAYGWLLGPLLLLLILTAVVRGLHQNDEIKTRMAIIFVSELLCLMWSGSFIMFPLFFVGLASCLKSTPFITGMRKNK